MKMSVVESPAIHDNNEIANSLENLEKPVPIPLSGTRGEVRQIPNPKIILRIFPINRCPK